MRRDGTLGAASRFRWAGALAALLALSLLLACGSEGGVEGADSKPVVAAPLELDAEGMEAKVGEMLATADTLERHRLAIALADALDEENLPGAVAALDANLPKIDPHEIRILAHAWAEIDPAGALDHMLENWRYPRVSNQAIEEVVYVWASSGDAAAARAYVDPTFDGPIPAPRSPTKFMQLAVLKALGVAQEWDQLTGLFGSIEDEGDREFWLTRVLIEINRVHDASLIKAWVDSIPWDAPNDLKVSALKRGIDWRARASAETAQDWYEEIESHPRAPEVMAEAVVKQGIREPAEALAWLRQRPPGATRDRLIREIVAGWLGREDGQKVVAAREWVRANSEDEVIRDLVAGIFVKSLTKSVDYEAALDYAYRYPEAAKADRIVPVVLAEWATFDEPRVGAYIEENDLDEATVAAYHEQLARRRDTIDVRRARGTPAKRRDAADGGRDR